MGEQTRKRFERECRAMAALADHPNIVSIFEHGIAEESRRPFIVMEYVSGGSLAARGVIEWERALEIGVKLCGALETAHRAGILHRDLKPENVLVSAFGQVMLADFGVAKVQDSSETPTGNITASILHAAPELLTGQRPEIATDVYSLASTIYSLHPGPGTFRPSGRGVAGAAHHEDLPRAPARSHLDGDTGAGGVAAGAWSGQGARTAFRISARIRSGHAARAALPRPARHGDARRC